MAFLKNPHIWTICLTTLTPTSTDDSPFFPTLPRSRLFYPAPPVGSGTLCLSENYQNHLTLRQHCNTINCIERVTYTKNIATRPSCVFCRAR
ncbi:hypothetical protein F4778DRAFT_728312 [Xylariomycetidae sp. FL2044]|nr:hypothetical protein F4778DRAFT_728312 [Xylariomycetidae sp. FL2044]